MLSAHSCWSQHMFVMSGKLFNSLMSWYLHQVAVSNIRTGTRAILRQLLSVSSLNETVTALSTWCCWGKEDGEWETGAAGGLVSGLKATLIEAAIHNYLSSHETAPQMQIPFYHLLLLSSASLTLGPSLHSRVQLFLITIAVYLVIRKNKVNTILAIFKSVVINLFMRLFY